ncbi:MAG: SdiA-regulated domain-containing protein [Candidatus Methylacidiphilales bacterium]|nr:SdiA-regulated domain-containing protein [Candidatus Methylacidiphilales bacterium]
MMLTVVLLLLLPGANKGWASPRARELDLEQALVIAGSDELDLSGLHLRNGKLLTVSDKVDDVVYEVAHDGQKAWLKVHRRFKPPVPSGGKLDWEAIQSGPDGSIYLASEKFGRVATLAPKARQAVWSTPSTNVGGISDPSAGVEGLALLEDHKLLLAKEREPRGLVLCTPAKDTPESFKWIPLTSTQYPLPPERQADFADLHQESGRVFALSRNAEMIVELIRKKGVWKEGKGWSFARAVRDPRHAYLASKFGQAEGLTMDASRIYLVIDNNRSGRAADSKDRRSTLFVFTRPSL